jgi:hypothetical protein
MFARSLSELEAIVRNQICAVCSDRTVDGECGLAQPNDCALFRLFPYVAKAIQRTSSDDIRDYIQAIREDVCSVCAGQAEDGDCESRREVRCSLDAYLLLVVEAIEEATSKKFDRDVLATSNGWTPPLGSLTRVS